MAETKIDATPKFMEAITKANLIKRDLKSNVPENEKISNENMKKHFPLIHKFVNTVFYNGDNPHTPRLLPMDEIRQLPIVETGEFKKELYDYQNEIKQAKEQKYAYTLNFKSTDSEWIDWNARARKLAVAFANELGKEIGWLYAPLLMDTADKEQIASILKIVEERFIMSLTDIITGTFFNPLDIYNIISEYKMGNTRYVKDCYYSQRRQMLLMLKNIKDEINRTKTDLSVMSERGDEVLGMGWLN